MRRPGITRSAEGSSTEPDLVGALKVLDEAVGTEGGVLTSFAGRLAASRRGRVARLSFPVDRCEGGSGLALLKLVNVQPAGGLDAALVRVGKMSAGGDQR